VTLRELAKRLRIASLKTAGERLMAAVDCGALEQVETMSGRGGARYFKVLQNSEDLKANSEPDLAVFPPPSIVREIYFRAGSTETKEQREQREQKEGKARI
jgi:hypothetical protein